MKFKNILNWFTRQEIPPVTLWVCRKCNGAMLETTKKSLEIQGMFTYCPKCRKKIQ